MAYQRILKIKTKRLCDFVRINGDVSKVVGESKIKLGLVFVNSLHTTATVILQEKDVTVLKDMGKVFERLLPLKAKYEHSYEGDKIAMAHLKTNLLGSTLSLLVQKGELVFGPWQGLFLVELFEAREREAMVTVIGD